MTLVRNRFGVEIVYARDWIGQQSPLTLILHPYPQVELRCVGLAFNVKKGGKEVEFSTCCIHGTPLSKVIHVVDIQGHLGL